MYDISSIFNLICTSVIISEDFDQQLSFSNSMVLLKQKQLECGTMPNVIAALSNIGGALCSTVQSLADSHY